MTDFLEEFQTMAADIPIGWTTYPSGVYGSDIACGSDTDSMFSEDDGSTARSVALVAWRIVISDRDSIPDAPGEGFDVLSLVRRPATPTEQRMWPSLVQGALMLDERIATANVEFKQTATGTWEVTIEGTTSNDDPFDLVGLLSPDTTILKQLMGAPA
jgi:hypothetical protein